MTHYLVLLRHGQSQWNLENRFTGFKDVPLSEAGIAEASEAGRKLAGTRQRFDQVFYSTHERGNKTPEQGRVATGQAE
ncbi:MAG: histidine phosphatase family protein, partial [Alphaproteobacteria bacterium]